MPKLRLDTFKIDASEKIGERLRVDGRISRIGIQIYKDESGVDRREYRPPEEVFSKDSLASLRGIPITIQHPTTGMVTGDNYRRLSVGHVGDDPRTDDDNTHVIASLWILDGSTIKKVESGELTELSVGYWASVEEVPGISPNGEKYDAVQRNIQGNHLALLKSGQARGGPTVRMILDSDGNAIISQNDNLNLEKKGDRKMVKIKIDGVEYDTENQALAQAVDKERNNLTANVQALTKERDELKAKSDALIAEKEALQIQLNEATDPERITQAAETRANLLNDAKKLAPEYQFVGSEIEIKKAALEQVGIKLTLDSEDYITARFEAALEALPEKKNDSLNAARKAAVAQPGTKSLAHAGVHLDRGLEN